MKKVVTFLLFILFICNISYADNYVHMISDSTGKYAQFIVCRTNKSVYQITMENEAKKVIYTAHLSFGPSPITVSIPWENYPPGIYFVTAKSKKEKFKLMYFKK